MVRPHVFPSAVRDPPTLGVVGGPEPTFLTATFFQPLKSSPLDCITTALHLQAPPPSPLSDLFCLYGFEMQKTHVSSWECGEGEYGLFRTQMLALCIRGKSVQSVLWCFFNLSIPIGIFKKSNS